MSDKEVDRWETTRAKGKRRFIFLRAAIFGSMLFFVKIVSDLLWGDPIELRLYYLWLSILGTGGGCFDVVANGC